MAVGRRNYRAGDTTAMVVLAQGRCYAPGCPEPLTKRLNERWVNNYDIAHIRALKVEGPRYDPNMTDAERNSVSNLLLLCAAHHRLVDRIAPHEYSVDLLESWKAARDTPALKVLTGPVTDERVADILNETLERQTTQLMEAMERFRRVDPQAAEIVEQAMHAADELSHLPQSAGTLLEAAELLSVFQPSVYALNEAAELLGSFSIDIGALQSAAEELTSAAQWTMRVRDEY